MNHETNEIGATPEEHKDLGDNETLAFSPCDEGAIIMRSSTVELCVCHMVTRCHKKRLVWNSDDKKLQVIETVDNTRHERIEAHFYDKELASIRTITPIADHHKYIHIQYNRDHDVHQGEQRNAKLYAHNRTIKHHTKHEECRYLFEVEILRNP